MAINGKMPADFHESVWVITIYGLDEVEGMYYGINSVAVREYPSWRDALNRFSSFKSGKHVKIGVILTRVELDGKHIAMMDHKGLPLHIAMFDRLGETVRNAVRAGISSL